MYIELMRRWNIELSTVKALSLLSHSSRSPLSLFIYLLCYLTNIHTKCNSIFHEEKMRENLVSDFIGSLLWIFYCERNGIWDGKGKEWKARFIKWDMQALEPIKCNICTSLWAYFFLFNLEPFQFIFSIFSIFYFLELSTL